MKTKLVKITLAILAAAPVAVAAFWFWFPYYYNQMLKWGAIVETY